MKNTLAGNRELQDFMVLSFLLFLAVFPLFFYKSYGYLPDIWLKEDGVYESFAAILCIITGFALVWTRVKNRSPGKLINFWLLAFAFSLLLLGGEELSWGQRMFDIKIPDNIADMNFQRELNLHNLNLIQSHNNAVSVYLTKLLIIYLVIFPLFLSAFPTAHSVAKKMEIPIPSLSVALAALGSKLISTQVYRAVYSATDINDPLSIGEAFESNLELSLCWVAWNFIFHLRQNQKYQSG